MSELRPQILAGVPSGTKATGGRRVDFKIELFDQLIATKGTPHWWSRTAHCPCLGNAQTNQADPTCSLCKGTSWLNFLPDERLVDGDVDEAGNEIELNDALTAVSIPALITNVTKDPQIFERFGQWIFGVARASIQSPNRLGYRDKLTSRRSTLGYSQLITATGASEILVSGMRSAGGLWTNVASVNLLRSKTIVFKLNEDFEITKTGTLQWLITPPVSGTLLTLQGEFYPSWQVMDHVYADRSTLVSKKSGSTKLIDQFQNMPLHSVVKLDFLVDGSE